MADTMSFALLGSVLCALILLPVLCTWLLRGKIKEPKVSLLRIHPAWLWRDAAAGACDTACLH